MAYSLAWGTDHPGLLIYLVDLSGSMSINDKMHRVSNTIFSVTDSLVAECQDMGNYKDRFELHVVGYNEFTYDIFHGDVNAINDHLDLHADNEQFFDYSPQSKFKPQGLTNMELAFNKAASIINNWKVSNPQQEKPAPIVIHVTDGYPEMAGVDKPEAYARAERAAAALRAIAVPDGNVLLFNIHIDGKPGEGGPMRFLTGEVSCNEHIDERTKNRINFLFRTASPMTDEFVLRARQAGLDEAGRGSRFMVSNISSPKELAQLVAFGSTVSMSGGGYVDMPLQ